MSLIVFPCFSYLLLSPFVVTILFLFLVVVFCWSRTASSLDRWRASASTFFLRAPLTFFFLFFWALTEIKKQMCVKSYIKTVCPRQLEQTHAMVLPVSSVSVSLSFLFLRPLSRSWWSPSPLSSWMSGTFPKTHLLTPSKIWAGGGYLNLCIHWMGPLWPILSFYCTVTARMLLNDGWLLALLQRTCWTLGSVWRPSFLFCPPRQRSRPHFGIPQGTPPQFGSSFSVVPANQKGGRLFIFLHGRSGTAANGGSLFSPCLHVLLLPVSLLLLCQ